MSSSLEWRFEIQTHHRDRKPAASSATLGLTARNFGFRGEFRVCTNDPEPMKRNLLTEIENLSCQDCQIFRKTVITRLEARNTFFAKKIHGPKFPNIFAVKRRMQNSIREQKSRVYGCFQRHFSRKNPRTKISKHSRGETTHEPKFRLSRGASKLLQAHLGASRDHDLDDIQSFREHSTGFRDEFMMRSDRSETLSSFYACKKFFCEIVWARILRLARVAN